MKKIYWFLPFVLLAALPISRSAIANDDQVNVKEILAKVFPGVKVNTIEESPVTGILEVTTANKEVVYVTRDGKFLFNGELIDVAGRKNLTKMRIAAISRVDFSALPFEKAIKRTKGTGDRSIAVFTDPFCPYCKQFEKELDKLDDLTVYIFPTPLPTNPGADVMAHKAWCSADPAAAWHALMVNGTEPVPANADCKAPLGEILALAARLGINVTPTVYLENGEQLTGMIPAKYLESRFAELKK